jgi:hypothetical protein
MKKGDKKRKTFVLLLPFYKHSTALKTSVFKAVAVLYGLVPILLREGSPKLLILSKIANSYFNIFMFTTSKIRKYTFINNSDKSWLINMVQLGGVNNGLIH